MDDVIHPDDLARFDQVAEAVRQVRQASQPATMNPNIAAQGAKGREALSEPGVMDERYPQYRKAQDQAETLGLATDLVGGALPFVGPAVRGAKLLAGEALAPAVGPRAVRGSLGLKDSSEGFGLTTKTMERLPNKERLNAETITQQMNRADVSKPEKEIITKALEGRPNVDKARFTQRVEDQLLPLKVSKSDEYADYGLENIISDGDFAVRPGEVDPSMRSLGLSTANAQTHIWKLPDDQVHGIPNHFGDDPAYFAHTRRFDTAAPGEEGYQWGVHGDQEQGKIRHIVEVQSDLIQRASKPLPEAEKTALHGEWKQNMELSNLRGEGGNSRALPVDLSEDQLKGIISKGDELHKSTGFDYGVRTKPLEDYSLSELRSMASFVVQRATVRGSEILKKLSAGQGLPDKVKPLEKTWHQRILREENRLAAQEGINTMRVPVGSTAERVESWPRNEHIQYEKIPLDPYTSTKGETYTPTGKVSVHRDGDSGEQFYGVEVKTQDGSLKTLDSEGDVFPWTDELENKIDDFEPVSSKHEELSPEHQGLFNFYDKDLRKFATKEFGAKEITDSKGNKWMEWKVNPESSKKPIQALGVGAATGSIVRGSDPDYSPVDKHIQRLKELRNANQTRPR